MLDHVSYSALKTWLVCPLKHKYAYIDQLPPAYTPEALAFGGAFHQAAAYIHRHLDEDDLTLDAVTAEFRNAWTARAEAGPEVRFSNGHDEDYCISLAERMLRAYLETLDPDQGFLAVEEEMTAMLVDHDTGEVLPVPVTGVPDGIIRRDGGAPVILEIKTTGRRPSGDRIPEDHRLQAAVYGYITREAGVAAGDKQLVEIRYVTKTREPEVVTRVLDISGSDYSRVFAYCREMLRAVEAGLAWPTPSHLCPCPYADYCRAWR